MNAQLSQNENISEKCNFVIKVLLSFSKSFQTTHVSIYFIT